MSALPRVGALLVLAVVATLAFVLSFTALADLAARNAVPAGQAWMIPIVVDASVIGATLAVVTMRERRWYAWSLLALAASLSVAGNVAHAWTYGPIAVVIAAVPPLFLLAMTELAVALTRKPVSGGHDHCKPLPLFPVSAHDTDVPDLAQKWRSARNVA